MLCKVKIGGEWVKMGNVESVKVSIDDVVIEFTPEVISAMLSRAVDKVSVDYKLSDAKTRV